MQKNVETLAARLILEKGAGEGSVIKIDAEGNGLTAST